jgi:hypothetical protein
MDDRDIGLVSNLLSAACFLVFWGFVGGVAVLLTDTPQDLAQSIRDLLN